MTYTDLISPIPRPSRLLHRLQARVRPPDIPLETVQEVLDCYRLTLTAAPRNLPLGRRSRNVVLDTNAGKKVLKRYRAAWQEPAVTWGHAILLRLAELDFAAPRPVATPAGHTFIALHGTHYALFDFLEGRNFANSYLRRAHWLELLGRAGRTLARFHHQLAGFTPPGRHHLGFRSYTDGRWQDLAWYTGQLEQLEQKSAALTGWRDQALASWLVQKSGRLRAELQHLDGILEAVRLPRMLIHGDFAIQNLLFRPDGVVVPLDFELARLEWRLSDLVTSLARLRRGPARFDLQSMNHFVAAYQTEFPISAEEWGYLPLVWRFRRLHKAVVAWKSYFDRPAQRSRLIAAHEAVQQAEWAAGHHDELLALYAGYRPAPDRGYLESNTHHLTRTAS